MCGLCRYQSFTRGGRFLTHGMAFIPEEGNSTLIWHIPPFQRTAKYTDDTSDTHFSFGLILLESAFPFPLSFLLSTVCLRCFFYRVIKIIFSGAVPFIYQPIHPHWMNFLFPGKRLSLLTWNNPWLKWLSVDRQAGNLDRDPALRRSWITLWFWARCFLMSPLPNYPSFCCKNPLLSAKVHIFLTWSRPHWHLILFMHIM